MLGLQIFLFIVAGLFLAFIIYHSYNHKPEAKQRETKPKETKSCVAPSPLPKGAQPKVKKAFYPVFRFRSLKELFYGRIKFFRIRKKDCEAAARIKCPMERGQAYRMILKNTFRYSVNPNY